MPISIGILIAAAVGVAAFIFLVAGVPSHVIDIIFGLILALAIARIVP